MKTQDFRSYRRTQMQRNIILDKLKAKGCRITKQRRMLIDIILENDCASCKEIFYQASRADSAIGTATVYRMVNVLEEIGAVSRKNMYKVAYSDHCGMEEACKVELEDQSSFVLSAKEWHDVVRKGLRACGYVEEQKISNISIRPCDCETGECI